MDQKKLLQITDEDVEALKKLDEKVVFGKVLKIEAHPDPNMTKVRVTETQIGPNGETATILCGGTNLEEGQIVVVATEGSVLPGDFKIGARDLRGVTSHGMICARKELEISLNGEQDKEIWPLHEMYANGIGHPVCKTFSYGK